VAHPPLPPRRSGGCRPFAQVAEPVASADRHRSSPTTHHATGVGLFFSGPPLASWATYSAVLKPVSVNGDRPLSRRAGRRWGLLQGEYLVLDHFRGEERLPSMCRRPASAASPRKQTWPVTNPRGWICPRLLNLVGDFSEARAARVDVVPRSFVRMRPPTFCSDRSRGPVATTCLRSSRSRAIESACRCSCPGTVPRPSWWFGR